MRDIYMALYRIGFENISDISPGFKQIQIKSRTIETSDYPTLRIGDKIFQSMEDCFGFICRTEQEYQKRLEQWKQVDQECSVLDEHMGVRRIALQDFCTLEINNDLEMSVQGPERDKYMRMINDNCWDPTKTILENLNLLFGDLPSYASQEQSRMECGICSSTELNEKLPETACSNPECMQKYHHECVLEWFRSVPSIKRIMNVYLGSCPYCNQTLSVAGY